MREIFPLSKDKKETFVSSSFDKSQFNPKTMISTKNYKMYLLAYTQYAKSKGFKLKKLTFSFVAPKITKEAFELAYILNYAHFQQGDVEMEINLYTFQTFYQLLLDAISDKKWFIKNSIPFNCLAQSKVQTLLDYNLAELL